MEGSKTIPCKVHFPFILHLKRMYQCKSIAQLMQWHEKNSLEDGMVRFVVHSKAWKHINAMWPNFTKDPKNLRFVLTTDGMNPFGDFNFKHSTWLILLLMYNLFPWLVINIYFYVISYHPWKGISQGCKYEHIHGTFD